jgi:hypothetical protein
VSWIGAWSGAQIEADDFARRPLVVVEDHLHHVTELLEALAEADTGLLGLTTVLCLDRPGPDTARLVDRWLATYPALQVAARLDPGTEHRERWERWEHREHRVRCQALDPAVFESANRSARAVAAALRPGGLLLQDIQLETLRFIPRDRWWESIYLASTVRGTFAENPPICRFLSNKRGYEATFGRELLDAGFDPRDVMDKGELRERVVPTVRSLLDRAFPWRLEIAQSPSPTLPIAVARTEEDRREVETELDLVLWCGHVGTAGTAGTTGMEIGGRLLAGRLSLKAGSQEAATWSALVEDRLTEGEGVPVVSVGQRIAPESAGRAEVTNLAARHVHGLRSRLADPGAIVTAHHAYRLAAGLRVGRVTARTRS